MIAATTPSSLTLTLSLVATQLEDAHELLQHRAALERERLDLPDVGGGSSSQQQRKKKKKRKRVEKWKRKLVEEQRKRTHHALPLHVQVGRDHDDFTPFPS